MLSRSSQLPNWKVKHVFLFLCYIKDMFYMWSSGEVRFWWQSSSLFPLIFFSLSGEIGTATGRSIGAITHWNYRSICRGSHSLLQRLTELGINLLLLAYTLKNLYCLCSVVTCIFCFWYSWFSSFLHFSWWSFQVHNILWSENSLRNSWKTREWIHCWFSWAQSHFTFESLVNWSAIFLFAGHRACICS